MVKQAKFCNQRALKFRDLVFTCTILLLSQCCLAGKKLDCLNCIEIVANCTICKIYCTPANVQCDETTDETSIETTIVNDGPIDHCYVCNHIRTDTNFI